YFTIAFPDSAKFVNMTPPFFSSRSSIREVKDVVTLGVDDVAQSIAQSGGTFQAATLVPMLRFTLTTSISQAYWTAIRLERTRSSGDPAFPFGRNTDVKHVQIWRDTNFNDQLDPGDELLSSATTEFNLTDMNDRIVQVPLSSPVLLSPT